MHKIKGLFFTLHTSCNFNCSYCWQKHKNVKTTKLKPTDVIGILDFFFENYFLFYPKEEVTFTFSGGDSLFFEQETLQYIQHIYGYGNVCNIIPKIVLQTNGSKITEGFLQKLKNYPVIFYLSYDGAAQNITRRAKEVVNANMNNILCNHPQHKVIVNSTYTPETIHLIYDSYLELKDCELEMWSIGIDFLRKSDEYDQRILLSEFTRINQSNKNIFPIKNIVAACDKDTYLNSLYNSLCTINITPEGNYLPNHFFYNENGFFNGIFGNYFNNDFNLNHFQIYLQEKEHYLNSLKVENRSFDAQVIVNNLLNLH